MSRKLIAVAPLLLFAAAGFAQTSNIQGDVKGQDGKPLQGAQIKLDRTDIKQSFSVKTDKNGHFLYANLPTGTYTITVQVTGKDVGQVAGFKSRPGDNPPLQFDLSKPPEAPAAAAAGPAPARDAGMTKEQRAKADQEQKAREEAAKKAELEEIQKAALPKVRSTNQPSPSTLKGTDTSLELRVPNPAAAPRL